MNKISVLTLLLLLIFVSCKNKSLSSSEATESGIDDSLSNVGLIADVESSEDYDDDSSLNAGWKKGYLTDEFGDEDYNHPFIEQMWTGKRNRHFDCTLVIRISTDYGIQFGVMEDYNMANLDGVVLTGKFNGEKFEIPYNDERNGTITITDGNVISALIAILNSEGTLQFSFYRVDAFDAPQNRVFNIHTSTALAKAIQKYGIISNSGNDTEDNDEPEVIMDMDRLLERIYE